MFDYQRGQKNPWGDQLDKLDYRDGWFGSRTWRYKFHGFYHGLDRLYKFGDLLGQWDRSTDNEQI